MSIAEEARSNIIALLKQCKFRELCDKYCDDQFLWTIKGSSVLSGIYNDKEEFFKKVIDRLNKQLLPGWKMHILDSYLDNDTLIVEMKGEVKAKSGKDYNNEYCWIFKFADNKIISITAYYDSLLVNQTLQESK